MKGAAAVRIGDSRGGTYLGAQSIHDEIDGAVFAAYDSEDLGERLMGRPGATTPSLHKSDDQKAAEEELLARIVTLNQERVAEEMRGLVRWLRTEFHRPRLLHKVSGAQQVEAELLTAGLFEERSWRRTVWIRSARSATYLPWPRLRSPSTCSFNCSQVGHTKAIELRSPTSRLAKLIN